MLAKEINTEKVFPLEEIFNSALVKVIYKEIMDSRKCIGDDSFTYGTFERSNGEKTYIITARHIPYHESIMYGVSSCKYCHGTGKKIMDIEKSRISNVKDFVMLTSSSSRDLLSEEQTKIMIEREKNNKFWRVALPCPCTIKSMLKKGKHISANGLNNIVVEISCKEKNL